MSGEDSFILVSARYDSVDEAEAGFQSVRTAYADAGHDGFDAAVYSRDRSGRFILHFGTDAPEADGSGGRGLADQVGRAVFDGLAETGSDEMAPREDLRRLADLITPGSAALLVAFRPSLEPLVTPYLRSDTTATSHEIHASEADLRSQLHDARESAESRSNRGATGV